MNGKCANCRLSQRRGSPHETVTILPTIPPTDVYSGPAVEGQIVVIHEFLSRT